jgi:tRNA (guanine-N7-)-methyltransferase
MTEIVDPEQFVITRRRKKYKFALYANSPICYELDEWKRQAVDVIELGAGTALFSVELAARHTEKTFVAVDVKADRLQKGARLAEENKLKNIWFIRARADQLDQIVPESSLAELWITFPDPFSRDRSAGRRMTHPKFLELYEKLLHSGGSLFLKHDNRKFFDWSEEQLVQEKWVIKERTHNLHKSSFDEDYKIMTTYETRWLGEGLVTNFLKAQPGRR